MARSREPLLVLVLLLAALFVRVPVLLRNPLPAGDGIASNIEAAVNLSEGRGFSTMRKWILYDGSKDPLRPEGNRQPAMALLLLALFLLTGPGFFQAQILSLGIGLFCLFMCWQWTRRVFGVIPAMATLAVLAVTPLFVWYSTQPDSLLLFTALFFAVLSAADGDRITLRRAALLGLLAGLAYLARTQGMLLAFSVGFWILLRGSGGRTLKTALFAAVFLAVCSPWFVRNIRAFGSPMYSQGGQFLLNENHWAAWEVRQTPPGPMDLLNHRGPGAVAAYIARGAVRVLEPVTTGSLHRGEVFGQPSLVGFAVLAILALRDRATRSKMFLPALAVVPQLLLLVLHEHSGRYLAFLIVIATALGSAGLLSFRSMTGRTAASAVLVLLLLPFAVPLGRVLSADSSAMSAEAREVSDWLAENSADDDWMVTYPLVELLIWDYRRPTLTMPNDYEMLLWPCLEDHGIRYVVVDEHLPVLRPRLADRWRRTADGTRWQVADPPEFLTEVYRSRSGRTLVYEMTGRVPEGFMAVDSLPRDNLRALPPSGAIRQAAES